jgi:hypothetical protein
MQTEHLARVVVDPRRSEHEHQGAGGFAGDVTGDIAVRSAVANASVTAMERAASGATNRLLLPPSPARTIFSRRS